ncbi:MAG: hypothetical protein KTR30_09225 [Saprospiraceae bacterium]|nr:hypothetical protein [Saprospiraceae bacterium]
MYIFRNKYYSVSLQPELQAIQFHWEKSHAEMTYEDFQEACCNFLGYGFEYQVKQLVIDVRNFQLSLPPEFPAWQQNEHYPRYYKLGIEKVAYIMPAVALDDAKEVEKTEGKFALKNFPSLEAAKAWLH